MSEAFNQHDVLKLGQLLGEQNSLLRQLVLRNIDQTRAIQDLQGRLDERDAQLAALTEAVNGAIRQVRTTLQQAQRASSRSQELSVAHIRTPVPPKPHRR